MLVVVGMLCVGVAIAMAIQVRKQLTLELLVGLPEVDPHRYPGKLLTEGMYARIRHPRYVESMLGIIGCSLLANYLALYLPDGLLLACIYAIALLEERELRERFGRVYEDYCRRVPRFVPRL